jgi:hypothetical protein
MSEAVLKAHVAALDATYEALARKPFKTLCAWCRATTIAIGHPNSSGICDACLEREYPEDAR